MVYQLKPRVLQDADVRRFRLPRRQPGRAEAQHLDDRDASADLLNSPFMAAAGTRFRAARAA